jgi:hypothetical protein
MIARNETIAKTACIDYQVRNAVPLPSYFLFENVDGDGVWFRNPLQLDLKGTSGGPVLTERSEIIGLMSEFRETEPSRARAIDWKSIDTWLSTIHALGWRTLPKKLGSEAHSAALLRRNNVEVSAGVSNVQVPTFGFLQPAPQLRIATTFPGRPAVGIAFDFTGSQGTGTSTLSLNVAAATAELRVGNLWNPLRRRDLLGGLYLAAGAASVGLQRTLDSTTSIRPWAVVFDAGWHYQLRGRSWGVNASYREGVLFGSLAQQTYPRFRSPAFGLFMVFR